MKIALPQLSDNLDVLRNLKRLILRDETLSSASLHAEDIAGLVAKSFSANDLRIEKIKAAQAKLENSSFTDVVFSGGDLTAVNFASASWRRVSLQNLRASGLQLQNSMLQDVTFLDCKLNLANFRFAKLKHVRFADCLLDEADFYMAELEGVRFERCTLTKTEFSGAKLKQVDLRGSDIGDILGVASLHGAIIDSIQLVALAPLLATVAGIKIQDE